MSGLTATQNAKEVALEAIVIRADGTREDLGTIAYWHKNPIRRWAHRLLHPHTGKIR